MKPINILLAEDNERDILLTKEVLKDNTITVIKDGWEAVQFLEKKGKYSNINLPDLILLDVNLPKINGQEVLKSIKLNNDIKSTPVIALTTYSSQQDILEAHQNYANCFIAKPVDADNFLKVIASTEDFWINIVQLPKQSNN